MNAGDVIGRRYHVERLLGGGGMALVYAARDEKLTRPVAVKVLADNLAEHEEVRTRFVQEARIAASLSHPNIVDVYDTGENGRPYIVMEYLEGPTLAEELRRQGRLPASDAADAVAQVADGLAHAHAAGVVHRDVKPENLIRAADGTVKITDFGIAHAVEATRLTQTGTVLGTASYLAPEQAAGDKVTPATDVYALGVVLYELLTGRLPFTAASITQALTSRKDKAIEPPSAFEATVPPELDSLVARCLALEPRYRPSARELSGLLREREASETVTELSVPRDEQPTRVVPRQKPSRKLWLAVLAAAIAVGAIALAAIGFAGGSGRKSPSKPAQPVSQVRPVPPGATPALEARNLARWLRSYSS